MEKLHALSDFGQTVMGPVTPTMLLVFGVIVVGYSLWAVATD